MDIIHLLPDSVANQIAAGEVIQRPASCLKELVENSLDAGADNIQILVKDAGRTYIQVIDNGKGMSQTDARMAFERHATSKISQAADLFNLHTMGFRGEALASIAAVAQVEVLTRRQEDEVGTLIEIAGSRVVRQEAVQTPIGTNFKVKNLFYNVPARRRFLKTNTTEIRNLINEFYRIALVYPKVHFLFVSDDEVLFDLPEGTLKQRIENIFGRQRKDMASQLVDLKAETALVNIYGYVGTPEAASKTPQQYFFVNGRYMKHPYFHKALMTAYQGTLPPEHLPHYFIYFDIAPDSIDINIHPTKTEIKFADEQAVWQVLLAAVRTSLGKFNLTPSLDFNREGDIEIPMKPRDVQNVQIPSVNLSANYNPFERQQKTDYTPQVNGWEKLYESNNSSVQSVTEIPDETDVLSLFDTDYEQLPMWQYKDRYILIAVEQGLLLLDQHLVHSAVLYEQFVEEQKNKKGVKQQVLFPEILDLNVDDTQLILDILPDLNSVGFDISQIAKNSFSVDSVPAQLGGQNALKVLLDILHQVGALQTKTEEAFRHIIALQLASQSAVRAGKRLTDMEMRELVRSWSGLTERIRTADGKRMAVVLSDSQIDKYFN